MDIKEKTMEDNKGLQVFLSVCEIQGELSKEGIGKDNTNKQQGWKFRGIDDVYNAIAPKLAKHKVVIIPTAISRIYSERKSTSGSALFSVVERMAYDVVSAIDGSRFTMVMDGEAMDSGDKATSKAASIAYKYACFQLFCIPTEGDNDPDATTHAVAPSTEHKAEATKPAYKSEPKSDDAVKGRTSGKVAERREGTYGFVTYKVNGFEVSTKKEELKEVMDKAHDTGVEVQVDYTEAVKGKYTNRYIDRVEVIPAVPF